MHTHCCVRATRSNPFTPPVPPPQVVPLQRTALIEPEHYPRFTLLRQAWGSVLLAWDALSVRVPEVRCAL